MADSGTKGAVWGQNLVASSNDRYLITTLSCTLHLIPTEDSTFKCLFDCRVDSASYLRRSK